MSDAHASSVEGPSYEASELRSFCSSVLRRLGFSPENAQTAATVLNLADVRGIDSHGIARLPGYVRLVHQGRIRPDAQPHFIHETPSTATLDADEGLGLAVAQNAMRKAIHKAKTAGSGWVAIQNSSHFGIAYAHAALALEENMIGVAFTNASPLVAPAGGVQPALGTNPICMAFPAGRFDPVVVDMATTTVANGKLEIAARQGYPLPEGWAQDHRGASSSDPGALARGGTLLPLGSDMLRSSYKGYALGGMVDILSGVLSGANFGPWVPPFVSFLEPDAHPVGKGIGHFLGCWRVDAFRPLPAYHAAMDHWIEAMKSARPADGQQVLIPGEPERRTQARREAEGVPLHPKVVASLHELAHALQIHPPTAMA